MKEKIVLIGGGGHCKSCIDVIELEDKYEIKGIIDIKEKVGETISKYRIIASDEGIESLVKEYEYFFITIGQIKDSSLRVKNYNLVKKLGGRFPIIASPKAYISKDALIDEGTIVMHNSFINAAVKIGINCIINTGSIIEHDVVIGNNCHISVGAIISGGVSIGSGVFIGAGSVIREGIVVGNDSIIGAGSVIIDNLNNGKKVAGNPAKLI